MVQPYKKLVTFTDSNPESQKLGKQRKEATKPEKQSRSLTSRWRKAPKEDMNDRLQISKPLGAEHTQAGAHNDHGGIDQEAPHHNLFPDSTRYRPGGLFITNGPPSPGTSSSSSRRTPSSTARSSPQTSNPEIRGPVDRFVEPGATTVSSIRQSPATDVHPLKCHPSRELLAQDDVSRCHPSRELLAQDDVSRNGINSTQNGDEELLEPSRPKAITKDHQAIALNQRNMRNQTLLHINPISTEDVPLGLDGKPASWGPGSRFHAYSQPVTFRSPERSGGPPAIPRQSSERFSTPGLEILDNLQLATEAGETGQPEWPLPMQSLRNHHQIKRLGRIWSDIDLPELLRVTYVTADTPSNPLSPQDEEDLHITPRSSGFYPPMNEHRVRRNMSAELLSLPGHYDVDTLERERRNSFAAAALLSLPGHSHLAPSICRSTPSLRHSNLTTSTDSSGTRSLRRKLVQLLDEHALAHQNGELRNSYLSTSTDGSSSGSLFKKINGILSRSSHSLSHSESPIVGPIARDVRPTTSRDILRRQPACENLRGNAAVVDISERLSRHTSIHSIDMLCGVGRNIKKAAKGWRKLFYSGQDINATVIHTILSSAIEPALEGMDLDFERWGR